MSERGAKAVRFENPLMPDERLRQMYTAMVQVQMLEAHLGGRGGGAKGSGKGETLRGEEAARVSTTLSLGSGDLISDCTEAAGMDLLLGRPLRELKRRESKTKSRAAATQTGEAFARRLPRSADADEQVQMATGAAAALKAQGGGRVLLVYLEAGKVDRKRWKRVLGIAGRLELPVIYVVLPERGRGRSGAGELAKRARGWGVPGFPVDGGDAVAVYRVMQESLLRGRSGDGPALIECISFEVEGKAVSKQEDGVKRLGDQLLAKGVADARWMDRTRSSFQRRLGGGRGVKAG